jgi:ATP-dependent helicase/nuclease subunit A
MSQPIDQLERLRAIDPSNSYIVQAPAGSGKTELLSQRYLTLLTCVKQPEEILALTFTKKAAAEMRERILHALNEAKQPFAGDSDHERKRYELASQVLAHDEANDWQLCKNPNRMKIQTLDSLAARISKTRPILTEGNSTFQIEDNPKQYYQLAARNVIEYLHDAELEWQQAVYNIIQHLDVNLFKIENLFINILTRREQWLPYLLNQNLGQQIIDAIAVSQNQALNKLKCLETNLIEQWIEIGIYTDRQLETDRVASLTFAEDYFSSEHIVAWKALIDVVLKKDMTFRKRLDKSIGFPAPSTAKEKDEKEARKIFKEKATTLIKSLEAETDILEALREISCIPCAEDYHKIDPLIESLKEILPILTAELKHIFNQHHIIDFNELTSLAQATLMDQDQPSDIQLKLDYQIKHILVDEFQDTSNNQFQLLQSLTAGWEPNDGRTLFFVGDPMQSIYRFRQAEVGLFLQVQSGLFGRLPIEALNLQSNFRSSADVINWVNNAFKYIFPEQPIAHLGAVNYASSVAERTFAGQVEAHLFLDNEQEAENLCAIINKHIEENKRIALLVRSRNHLIALTEKLNALNIAYNATELERLLDDPLCLDLYSITQALCENTHKLAWLALLRSPFCGLTLDSLYLLAQNTEDDFLAHLNQQLAEQRLQGEEAERFTTFMSIMNSARMLIKKIPLAELVQSVWMSFKGEQLSVDHDKKQTIADKFFATIEKQQDNFFINDFAALYESLAEIRIDASHGQSCLLEIMTIHKSKGLEFDVVILPQLHRQPTHGDQQILTWSEFADDEGAPHFLLAPIKNNSKEPEPLYDYLRYLNKAREHFELQRLLYVACTRAKETLYLSGTVKLDAEFNTKQPSASTLLGLVWDHVDFKKHFESEQVDDDSVDTTDPLLKKVPLEQYRQFDLTTLQQYDALTQHSELKTSHFSDWRTQTGTLIHYLFSHALMLPRFHISEQQLNYLMSRNLIQKNDQVQGLKLIKQALSNLRNGEHGQWLLQAHEDKHTEFELVIQNEHSAQGKQYIDLTFIDNGTRWIVDHKVITSDNVSVNKLKQQYAPQLEAYRESMASLESRPCRLALYLPIQDELVEL